MIQIKSCNCNKSPNSDNWNSHCIEELVPFFEGTDLFNKWKQVYINGEKFNNMKLQKFGWTIFDASIIDFFINNIHKYKYEDNTLCFGNGKKK